MTDTTKTEEGAMKRVLFPHHGNATAEDGERLLKKLLTQENSEAIFGKVIPAQEFAAVMATIALYVLDEGNDIMSLMALKNIIDRILEAKTEQIARAIVERGIPEGVEVDTAANAE